MSGFKKLFRQLFRRSGSSGDIFFLFVKCSRCGEKLKILVHKNTDLMRGYGEVEPAYSLRKEAMDTKCLNKIKIEIDYDENFNEIRCDISGGERISEEEFSTKD